MQPTSPSNWFPRNALVLIFLLLTGLLQAGTRESTLLETGWKFKSGEVPEGERVTLGDSEWQSVTLPHSWGWEEAHLGKSYRRGAGWYRLELDTGEPQAGRRYFVRFEAASQIADVYLNDKWLGQHRGAFGAFCFEITGAAGKNVLAVRVTNEEQPDVAPLSGDFSIYGGIYRPARLIVTAEENFAMTDHGSPGVAWLQTKVSAAQATLDVTAQISNGTKTKQARRMTARVLDVEGKVIAAETREIELSPAVTEPHALTLTLTNPHLWNGRKDPYLYRAVIELSALDGQVIDSVEQPLGLRYYTVDPEKGFFLNGQPYALHGANRHQDRPVKGWAISNTDMDEDLALMLEMGCTAVRCAHYQHSEYFYGLCDKAGLLVWAEIPQVDTVNTHLYFATTSTEQLRDLIRQNINHPSIFAWSLYNEIRSRTPDPHRLLQDLNIIAKGEDPTRPTIAATCISDRPQMNRITDLLGWNVYPGWYDGWGTKNEFGAVFDKRRHDSRQGGICISEYGAGANVTQHENQPKAPKAGGPWHPEEWQAEVHEAAWAAIKARPYIWGSFVWVMFDFAVSTRHEGGIEGLNDKGLVTYDRKTRKDAFYFYKANWSDEPVLYIASRRFTERTEATTDVKVYSNAPEVELFVNGSSVGKRGDAVNGIFIWKDTNLKSGINKIEARAVRQERALSDQCEWVLKP